MSLASPASIASAPAPAGPAPRGPRPPDPDALAAAHVRVALAFAARACILYGVEHMTDEAKSECLITLVESARAWEDRGHRFSSYLYARIRAMVRWRFARDAARERSGTARDGRECDRRPGPAEAAERAEMAAGLGRARMRLSREEANVLRMRYDLGPPRRGGGPMGNPRVARELGRNPAWVRRTEERAISKLRDMMKEFVA